MSKMRPDWQARVGKLKFRVENRFDGLAVAPRGSRLISKFSPRDGNLIYEFAAGDIADVDRAVGAARAAFVDGRWRALPIRRRKEVLFRLADLIDERREDFGLLESIDVGKPVTEALSIDVPMAANLFRYAAEALDKLGGRVFSAEANNLVYQMRRPIGVVAGIVGWNFPLVLAASKVAPALATGNSVVLKPSELSSLSAGLLVDLALEAGLPAGVCNLVHGDAEVGEAIGRHHGVDLVSFTGSTRAGKELLVASGQSNMKRLILECGGKAANIVFDDCPDLKSVADAVVQRAFWNQGQVCTASSRLLVQRSIRDSLLPLIMERMDKLVPGDPLDSRSGFGALISQAHLAKVTAHVASAEQEGAHALHRTRHVQPIEGGYYLSPILFDVPSPRLAVAQDEIFGPVLSLLTFDSEEDAIRLANDTLYGLSAIVWTKDLGRAHRLCHSLNAGWVSIFATGDPKGGAGPGNLTISPQKQSGIGAEGGIEGLEQYLAKTAVELFV